MKRLTATAGDISNAVRPVVQMAASAAPTANRR
jgi:hypothetical protein